MGQVQRPTECGYVRVASSDARWAVGIRRRGDWSGLCGTALAFIDSLAALTQAVCKRAYKRACRACNSGVTRAAAITLGA